MKQPYMLGNTGTERVVGFEVQEEILPLLTEAVCDIIPETFDAGVVNTPVQT